MPIPSDKFFRFVSLLLQALKAQEKDQWNTWLLYAWTAFKSTILSGFWTPNSAYWANLVKQDESHDPQKACVAGGMKQTQFLCSPVGMLSWAGQRALSQLKGKDKGGEVPNNRFQSVTIQPQKGTTTIHNCFPEGWLYKEGKLYQKRLEACKSVKGRILCWRCRINMDTVGECGDLFELECCFLVLTQLSKPTSHKKHRPSHFLVTFIPPLIPLSPAALFYFSLLH